MKPIMSLSVKPKSTHLPDEPLMGVMSSMLTSSLIALTLSIPLMMASWFSPLLVIFHNVPPVAAMQRSFLPA
ncbi:MAG: hypothetical protein IPH22_06435 [Nitrosomonas sp.]|nr:hypothetical protein [Nitrosomonas sp.]